MTALRRDLIERKLWVLVVLLVAAIAAVPVLLNNGGSTTAARVPLPPPVTPTGTQPASHAKAVPVKDHVSNSTRDPFADASTTTSTTSTTLPPASSGTSGGGGSATPAASATSAPAASTTAAMVSPAPTSTSAAANSASSATQTSPHTTTSSAPSQPVSTTASVSPTVPAKVPSWTTYSVWVRAGKDAGVALRKDVARLTPLPSAAQPQAMFMGVMSGGRQAVFALRQGVGHSGPGLCRPGRSQCSVILLQAGQTEKLTVPANGGKTWQFILRVVHIASRVTHSERVARTAFERHSAAGLCDLAMADPLGYSLTKGTLLTIASAVCTGQKHRVAFPFAASIVPAAPASAASPATTAAAGSGS